IPCGTALNRIFSPNEPSLPAYYETPTLAAAVSTDQNVARSVLLERIKVYRDGYGRLVRTTYYWVLFIGLTTLVLVSDPASRLPFSSIQVPSAATHAFLIGCMLYLWMDFGSTLKALISDRMSLWKLVDHIEGPAGDVQKISFASVRPL